MSESATATPSSAVRREEILALLDQHGVMSVDLLASRFGVSGMTVRRDLQELAEAGKVLRTHGGAAPTPQISFEFRFLERAQQQSRQKEALADVAATLVQPGQAIILDSGTTTLAIARKLKAIADLTVITTSLPIASELFGCDRANLILLGGQLRKGAPDLIGALTDHSLNILRADVAFLGADAVDNDGHVYSDSPELGRLLARMADVASHAYIVADSSKIGHHGLMRFAHLKDWEGLITDNDLSPQSRRKLQKQGVYVFQPNRLKKGAAT